ncbi:hypothetical protein EHQ97_14605 [Leptospira adleri]|nr:hypothetical protein EHQ97_14605 [Leptospira adleri]
MFSEISWGCAGTPQEKRKKSRIETDRIDFLCIVDFDFENDSQYLGAGFRVKGEWKEKKEHPRKILRN